jgi:hypothetical protein
LFALGGQLDIISLTNEELFPERILKLTYSGTHRRLGDKEVFSSLSEMPGPTHLNKCSEIINVHESRLTPCFNKTSISSTAFTINQKARSCQQ